MRITHLEVYGYELTYAHGEYVMSGGRGALSQSSTVVRLCTDEDIDGWAEVAPLGGTYLPTFAAGIRAALAELSPALVGADPTNTSVLHQLMDQVLLDQQAAKSVIDIAAWDIKGKAADVPVSDLLGGRLNQDFGLYEAVSLDTPENMVSYVQQRYAAGITSFQLKVGNDPAEDAERTRAVAEAVGGKVRIIADANGGWDVHDAVAAVRAMADLPVYIEQPCRSLKDNALVQTQSALPLILDESVVSLEDLYRAKYHAHVVAINLKFSRVGGLTKAALLRDAAQELGLKVSMEDTWGGDLSAAAVSHLAATTGPDALMNVSFYNDWNLERICGYQPRSQHGRGSAPTGPGLGVTVDTSQLTHLVTYQ